MTTQNAPRDGGKAVRLSALVLTMSTACSSSPPPPVENAQLPIVGGTTAPLCAWPSVVLVSGDCTGTLVHPQVVVTAAHCVNGKEAPVPADVSFGESALDSPAKVVKVSKCKASPKYAGGETDDIGYCILAQPVTDVPIVPVMAACEASALKTGVDIVEVGYGQSAVKSGANDGFGVKRFIAGKINSVISNGQINVTTGNQNGEYFGDSGGPIFAQMADKTWRFIGADCCSADIVSGSTSARVSTYTSAPLHVAWLESDSGFDLTPCHDGSTWNPEALCGTLPTTPDKASGGWSSMCASTQGLTAPQATCNASNGAGGAGGFKGTGAASMGGAGGAGGSGGDAGSADAGNKADASDAANGKGGDTGTGGRAGAGGSTGTGGVAGSTGTSGTGGGSTGGSSGAGGSAGTGGTTGASGGAVASHGGSSGGKGGASGSAGAKAEAASSSGCSCKVGRARSSGAWEVLPVALGLAAHDRRRRRQR